MPETYTPGNTENASAFMARRTFESHGRFFAPHLSTGLRVLDCGCGPGSITLGIAETIRPGVVTGIDRSETEIAAAAERALESGIGNAEFRTGDCYSLSFDDETFDRVFSHALMEHLAEPARAIAEFHRVLKPGGIAGLCSPDWGGFIISPPSPSLSSAVGAYMNLQIENGGDVLAGGKLGVWLNAGGFVDIEMTTRYEDYPSLPLIGDYLAVQLDKAKRSGAASTLRKWSRREDGRFAQAWVSAIGRKPE